MIFEPGVLYVVATPIGNLQDITARALEVLARVDLILAEDTRHSIHLLRHYGIHTPMKIFHDHNERQMAPWVEAKLQTGMSMALISDAGTPLVNDPGYPLINLLRTRERKVVPIPGPSALTCALSVSGLPTDRFVFEGFLPAKQTARRERLLALAEEARTLIFFESPHRIPAAIADAIDTLGGERHAAIAKEMTKRFENIQSGTLTDLRQWLTESTKHQWGEFVLVVAGRPKIATGAVDTESLRVLRLLLNELPPARAAALTARLTGANKNALYRWALQERGDAHGN